MLTPEDLVTIYAELGLPASLKREWCPSEENLSAVAQRVHTLEPQRVLQVGAGVGVMTLVIAASAPPEAEIHVINEDLPLNQGSSPVVSLIHPIEIARAAAERSGLSSKIYWYCGRFAVGKTDRDTTENGLNGLPVRAIGEELCEHHGPFDFIFLDSLHAADVVRADLELADRFLRPGGLIAVNGFLNLRRDSFIRRGLFEFLRESPAYILEENRDLERRVNIGFLRHFPPGAKAYELSAEYDEEFFDRCLEMHQQVVPHLARKIVERYAPKSVIDLGCGAGMWLRAFHDLGVVDLYGMDGSPKSVERCRRDFPHLVSLFDLRAPFHPPQRYDLCLCLDVLEHIEPEFETHIIESMVNCSDTIVFSSPPPGQGGDQHVNERPIGHWVKLFFPHGYVLVDELRPVFEELRDLPETTYQLNCYTVKRVFHPSALPSDETLRLLIEKESRIEGLFLESFFQRREIERLRRRLTLAESERDEILGALEFTPLELPADTLEREEGYCYVYKFRSPSARSFSNALRLLPPPLRENDRELRPGNAPHTEIRTLGNGRYSYWNDQIYFSSSDNTSPVTNGRKYVCFLPRFISEEERRTLELKK